MDKQRHNELNDQELDEISGGIGIGELRTNNSLYPTIPNRSQDAKHDKWIDVLSIDWGSHKPGGGATG